nr:phosphatase PAP2 family protein [Candidatus Gracilibacteria bacterium]
MFLQTFNEVGLTYLNSFSINNKIATIVGIFADAPIFFIPIFLIVTWVLLNYKKKGDKKEEILIIFYSTIIGIVFALIIQHLVHMDRPENYIKTTGKLLLKHIPDASFPSDHATVSFAFLTSLYFANYKKVFYAFLPFVCIMLLSRVIAGVHWPLDIVVGTIIGIFSSYITFKYLKKLEIIKKINKLILKIASFVKL